MTFRACLSFVLLFVIAAISTVSAQEECGIPDYLGECIENHECWGMYSGSVECRDGVCMCDEDICGCDVLGPATHGAD